MDARTRALAVTCVLAAGLAPAPGKAGEAAGPLSPDPTARTRPLGTTPSPTLSLEALSPDPAPGPAHQPRVPAPPEPISEERALREWDGTGELLLARPFRVGPGTNFTVGAALQDGGTAAGAEENEGVAERPCMEGTYAFRLSRGSAGGTAGPDHSRFAPRVVLDRRGEARGLTFARPRCRVSLFLRLMVPDGRGWVETREREPFLPHPSGDGEGPYFRSSESFILPTRPEPAELSPEGETGWGLGEHAPAAWADRCPWLLGSLMFTADGLRVTMPWRSDPPITPGLRRDAGARKTTLIFQAAGCRVEIDVDRRVEMDDGLWIRSPLAPIGPPGGARP